MILKNRQYSIITSQYKFNNLKGLTPNDIDQKWLGSYLAGVIEGDGYIVGKSENNKLIHRAEIVYNINDLEPICYIKEILEILGIKGSINKKNNKDNYVIYTVSGIHAIHKLASITNGYYRTPKYIAFESLVNTINKYISEKSNVMQKELNKITLLPIDESSLSDSAWLSGFIDSDGMFQIIIEKGLIAKTAFGLQSRKYYHKDVDYKDYKKTMTHIGDFLKAKVGDLVRKTKTNPEYKYYNIYTKGINTAKVFHEYFDVYPLLTYKRLNYNNYKLLTSMVIKGATSGSPMLVKLAKELHKNHNTTRTIFNYEHLYNEMLFIKPKKF